MLLRFPEERTFLSAQCTDWPPPDGRECVASGTLTITRSIWEEESFFLSSSTGRLVASCSFCRSFFASESASYDRKNLRGLANGGFFGPFRGNFCSSPVAVKCGPERARVDPGKAPISPERPDFWGLISPRFSLKIWGLSSRL